VAAPSRSYTHTSSVRGGTTKLGHALTNLFKINSWLLCCATLYPRVCLGCRVFLNGDGVSRDPRDQYFCSRGSQESEGLTISCDWVFYSY
jgi:hypothetical protein